MKFDQENRKDRVPGLFCFMDKMSRRVGTAQQSAYQGKPFGRFDSYLPRK
jgi:hypothetical protein